MTVVAVDGPAGAGKSTVARLTAARLGFTYVDTGALYRAVALACLEAGVDLDDEAAVAAVAQAATIEYAEGTLLLEGADVSERIRGAEVTAAVSVVAAHPSVRTALIELQRRAAAHGDVVMEGRDIGSTVAPDATVKVFLTASLKERARRRWLEVDGRSPERLAEIEAAISDRDRRDSQREASPLVKAADAIELDTTGKSIDQVVDEICDLVRGAIDAHI